MFNEIVGALKRNLPRPIYNLIKLPYSIIVTNPRYAFGPMGFWQKTKLDLYELIGRKPKLIKYGNFKFYSPGWKMLLEKNGYYQLKNLKSILDLGGYMGDSAIELAGYGNKEIHAFEPEKEKFNWLEKNIALNKLSPKIKAHNYAVINGPQKSFEIKKNGSFCGASSFDDDPTLSETETVKCISIKDVMKMGDFDGFKCDIEGGEFSLADYFVDNPEDFKFKKGVIEWHFIKEDLSRKNSIIRFIKFLKEGGYKFYFYPQNKPRQATSANTELHRMFDNPKYPYTNMFYFWKP